METQKTQIKVDEEQLICGRCGKEWEENETDACIHCNCMTAEIK